MSNSLAKSVAVPFERSYDFLMQFVDVCPESIWKATFGGWPVWQQVAHTFAAFDFFTRQPGDADFPPLCPAPVAYLSEQGTQPMSKEDIKKFAGEAKKRADAYIAGLADKDLGEINKPFAAASGKELTHAGCIAMLASHNFYHLGTCDAALRAEGLPGVF